MPTREVVGREVSDRMPPGPGAARGGGGGKRPFEERRILPDGIRRDLNRRRRVPNTVSLNFGNVRELPTSRDLGNWIIEQKLSPSAGFNVKRISRSEYDSKFYIQLDGEEMVEKFMDAIREDGREWTDEVSGHVYHIKAKKEGDEWIKVNIANIDQDTEAKQVEQYFSYVGQVKDFKQDEREGMTLDSATIKVKLKDGAVMPTYLIVKGIPGDEEGVARWELDYPGKPSICYRCYQAGHWRRNCRNPAVPITALLAGPDLAEGGIKGSYAQAVRSQEAVAAEESKRNEQERERKANEDEKARKEEEEREERKKQTEEAEESKRKINEEKEILNKSLKELYEERKDVTRKEKDLKKLKESLWKRWEAYDEAYNKAIQDGEDIDIFELESQRKKRRDQEPPDAKRIKQRGRRGSGNWREKTPHPHCASKSRSRSGERTRTRDGSPSF